MFRDLFCVRFKCRLKLDMAPGPASSSVDKTLSYVKFTTSLFLQSRSFLGIYKKQDTIVGIRGEVHAHNLLFRVTMPAPCDRQGSTGCSLHLHFE